MTSRRYSLFVLFALLALLLTACPGGGDATDTGDDQATTQEEETDATTTDEGDTGEDDTGDADQATSGLPEQCSNVQIEYWNPFTGPDGPNMGRMVDEFSAEQENIDVTMTTQSEYYTQLSTAAASDTLPDVAIIHADQVATHAFRNIIRPMDDVVEQVGIEGGDFPEAVWNAGDVGGVRYSIPLDIHPMTMFYNADMFAEAGIDGPPATDEEFAAAADAMTTGDNNGFLITSGFPVRQIFEMMLYQYGGTSFNEDGTEATWNSEAGVQALQWMKDAQEQWSEPNLEVDAELNAFKAGQAGMVWNGIWQLSNLTGDAVMFDGQATTVPQIGDQMAVWAGSHQLTLPTQDSPDECKDAASAIFIEHLVNNTVEWARAGQIPASNSVRESDEFQALDAQSSIAPSVEHAFFPPAVPGITDAYAPLDEAVGAVMAGTESDPQAALDDAAQRANQILAENAETYGDAP